MKFLSLDEADHKGLAALDLHDLLQRTMNVSLDATIIEGRNPTLTSAYHFDSILIWFIGNGITEPQAIREKLDAALVAYAGVPHA